MDNNGQTPTAPTQDPTSPVSQTPQEMPATPSVLLALRLAKFFHTSVEQLFHYEA